MSSFSSNCKNVDRMHSLKELCKKALTAHIDRLRYLGTIPQYLVADVLAHCTVDQLETLEHYNPHIRADNEDLWMSHCARKYKELAELQSNIAEGLAEAPTKSWREIYWEMKRQDELRAQAIMDRVRLRTAEMEREKNARKIQITNKIPKKPAVSRAVSSSSSKNRQRHSINSKNMSLMQRARMITRNQLSMIGKFQKSNNSSSNNNKPAVVTSPPSSHVCQISPAGSPGYSPSYLSSASPCSPPHSSGYSPPYVPETDYMGSSSYGRPSPTVSVKTKALPSKRNLEESTPITEVKKKRRRQEQHEDDSDKDKKKRQKPTASTESFFQMLAGNDSV